MNRTSLNFVIDLTAFLLFGAMVLTGFILWVALPPGSNKDLVLWGLARHEWGAIHVWTSIALLVTLGCHLALHWRWVMAMVRARTVRNNAAPIVSGVLFTLGVLGFLSIFAWFALQSVESRQPQCSRLGILETCVAPGSLPSNGPGSETQEARAGASEDGAVGTTNGSALAPSHLSTKERESQLLAQQVAALLQNRCASCHHSSGDSASRSRKTLRLDSLAALLESPEPLVLPGNPQQSRLMVFLRMAATRMEAKNPHHLSASELGLLEAWILAGAPGGKK